MDISKMRQIPTRKELAHLTRPTQERIDTSEIPELGPEFWENATRNPHLRFNKQQLTVRIDTRVLQWLKKDGSGYQTRLNQVLTEAMMRDLAKSPKRTKQENHRKAS